MIMKKIMFMVAACAAMVACNNGKTTANNEGADSAVQDSAVAGDSAVYEGLTPAADVAGIKYRVALAKDSSNGFLVVNDSTLRLVNSDFEEPAVNTKDMNYDLKLK